MTPAKKRRDASPHAAERARTSRDPRIVGSSAVVRGVALAMAVAAEPAWISGQWIALIGSIAMMLIASGHTPAAVARAVRGLVR